MRNGGDIGEFKPHASDIDSNTDSLSKLMLQTRERGLDFIYRGETETGEYICFSHKGLVREKNEDALGGNFKDLFVVADGMGGHKSGQEASKIAVEEVEAAVKAGVELTSDSLSDRIRDIIDDSVEVEDEEGGTKNKLEGMGTTLVAFRVEGDNLEKIHIGDSRLYIYNPQGELKYVSKDDSYMQAILDSMVKTGEPLDQIEKIDEREPFSGVISKAFLHNKKRRKKEKDQKDGKKTVQTNHGLVKIKDEGKQLTSRGRIKDGSVESEEKIQLEQGDIIIACSDGMNGMMPQLTIDGIVQSNQDDLRGMQEIFLKEALAGGGKDNISFIVYQHSKKQL